MGKILKKVRNHRIHKNIAVGANKGFIVSAVPAKKIRVKAVYTKGKLSKKRADIKNIIREVVGFAPYEKRVMELLKVGGARELKKALKTCKKRLGTHRRALKKRAALEDVVRAARKAAK